MQRVQQKEKNIIYVRFAEQRRKNVFVKWQIYMVKGLLRNNLLFIKRENKLLHALFVRINLRRLMVKN